VAAVPIFLLWLFVSWAILLFGARLAYVVQYAASVMKGSLPPASRSGREILAGQAMLVIARAYDRGAAPPDAGDLTAALGAQAEAAGEALGALKQANLVTNLADGGLVPSRPLERISLADVRRAVAGGECGPERGSGRVLQLVNRVEEEAFARLAAVTFRDLCDGEGSDAWDVPATGHVATARAGARPIRTA
jgi:membrane protein